MRPGSSPLSRGILFAGRVRGVQQRIIPALAGNTVICTSGVASRWDHPRSRGEYAPWASRSIMACGSSPLSRGIHGREPLMIEETGIIPALAGNTRALTRASLRSRDHPRSRGEYQGAPVIFGYPEGSSPLSRGIRTPLWERTSAPGIIPALAGNTYESRPVSRFRRDHPRSRGEYSFRITGSRRMFGSSPLSRGIPPTRGGIIAIRRIIPALAGNTPSRPLPRVVPGDHPRSRGEYRRWPVPGKK